MATVEIQLTKGQVAIIDEDDVLIIAGHKWSAHRSRTGWYARARCRGSGKHPRLYMHRLIMGAKDSEEIDHKNGRGLDNRRSNLRRTTHANNLANQAKQSRPCFSKFKGVSKSSKKAKPWRAYGKADEGFKHLGYFAVEEDAARAYDAYALAKWGEFARLNFTTK